MKTKTLIVGFVMLILLGLGFFGYMAYLDNYQRTTQAPLPDQTAGWNVLKNDEAGFSLRYPSGFFDMGHEPRILIEDCNYQVFPSQCPNIDKSASYNPNPWENPSGDRLTVNAKNYCVYHNNDAAMGSQYYYDYYVTVKNQKCVIAELVTRTTTCENYLPLEPGNTQQDQNYNACVAQRQNRPGILQQIVNTFKLN